ncbi:OLC1v1022278C1 [Oldenlandia corymbosa var. corymbosa]|uniref:OLC1v1022278C1 n=1 Tax=Oldenlandia corymbosa var. corymbosa TaxID=529605 RepID=A0AAV1C0A5_OLDCO|nr:OLC1v1022278C1 [Oldenlandia corymbosa var. corymbosa]
MNPVYTFPMMMMVSLRCLGRPTRRLIWPSLFVALVLCLVFDAATSSLLSHGPHLADVNVLLPPKMTYPVEYRLQGTDGCFDWSWDHHDILAVMPEYNSSSRCSTSARLKSIAPYSGQKETAVYATDQNTRMVIRCKVYIDVFSRIQIFHSSVKLDLDGLASLRVRAFDSEENVFSSLVGLQFMWQLMTETEGLPHHLVHVPLKDSPQSDCGGLCGDLDIQVKLEECGAFSDLYVVKGIEIGHEIVSVHLNEPSLEEIQDKVVLTVAEAMSLEPPSPVFVLVGAVVDYNLNVIRGAVSQVVSLPSPFHLWSAFNSSVVQVNRTLGKTHAISLGSTTIIVKDTRVADHVQTSTLHVVLPDTLLLYMLPLSSSGSCIEGIPSIPSMARWYVVSGRKYFLEVKVFSQRPGAEEIYITDSNDTLIFDDDQSELWNILPASNNVVAKKNTRILEANSNGLGKLMAILTYSNGHDLRKEVIKVVQEVMVCDEVKFIAGQGRGDMNRILLPWAPGVNQEMELRVGGGCAVAASDYKWFSSDMAVVTVSASGVLQSKKPGKAAIKAVSTYDLFNFDEIVVEVSIPSSMIMLQNFPVEIPSGSHIQASVALQAPDGSFFDRCDAFGTSIKWKIESDSFTIINSTGMPLVFGEFKYTELDVYVSPPCAWTCVHASVAGRAMLHATLTNEYQQIDQSVGGLIALKASILIASYNPLSVLQVSDGNQFGGYWFNLDEVKAPNKLENLDSLHLVPGTHFDVILKGGPERWDHGVEYIENVEILTENDSFLNVGVGGLIHHQEHANYGRIYRIQCEKLGNSKLAFKRGNLIGDNHPLRAVSEVQVLLKCSFPSSIVLLADEVVNSRECIESAAQADRSEGRIRTTPITVANGRTIRLSAAAISDDGKSFGNSSSLQLNWNLVDCDGLAVWDHAYTLVVTKSSWERYLILQNSSGLCTVRVTVTGFVDSVSHLSSIAPFGSPGIVLTDATHLSIISSLSVHPGYSLLFFSNNAILNLSIVGGSCFLEALVNDSHITDVIQPPPDLQCRQLMLAPKRLGTVLVTVHDIGLSPAVAASSVVKVADIDWMKITSQEEISIMQGNLLSVSFVAGTVEGHVFDYSQYIFMKIYVHFEDDIVELINDHQLEGHIHKYVRAPNFTIRGTHLGVTTLYLSARQHSGHEVVSQSMKLEVYSPPRLHPHEIFLVPGASYVLRVEGGPKLGAFVEYASMDDETAKFEKFLGQVFAVSPGNTTLVTTFYGKEDTMICQAFGKIKVGVPSAALLYSQSEKLAVGRHMPIFPTLSEGNLFSFYELCSNFKWTIEDNDVLTFHETHHHAQGLGSGVDSLVKEETGFLKLLQALSSGKTDVSVTFSCDFVSSGSFSESRLYSAHITLWVVPDLPLALGSTVTWILPPHYTSSALLPLTSNPHSKRDSSIHQGTISYSLLRGFGEVQDGGAISIDVGTIRTKEADDISCIMAKDRATGRIDVASCVRVAELAQIRLLAENALVLKLAISSEHHLPIQYYDVLGNHFHEAYNAARFEVETNYPHVVAIQNFQDMDGGISLTAKGQGKALVRVSFSDNPQKSDYMLINVGAHIYPLNPVIRLGSHLNFSVKGLFPDEASSGHWFTANSSIVYVDSLSGKAAAISEGSTHIYYECSHLKLHAVVTVTPGKLLTVDAPNEILTNAHPFSVKGYLFPVKVVDAYNRSGETFGKTDFFDCQVYPSFVGVAKPWLDTITGRLYCSFVPHSPEQLVQKAPEFVDLNHGVSISLSASSLEDRISGSASAIFVRGFSFLGKDEHSRTLQLYMTPESCMRRITIVGNTDVKITWRHLKKLSVARATPLKELNQGGHAVYEVKARPGAATFEDTVIVTLPATGQRLRVDVRFEANRRKVDSILHILRYAFDFWFETPVRAIMLCLNLAFAACMASVACMKCVRLRRRSSPGNAATPMRTPPALSTPTLLVSRLRRQDEGSQSQSPSSPEPFVDYVRRTLDETPYYRQDFRRRVNPQNTM